MLPSRQKADIIQYFKQKGAAFCNQIKEVCFDLWRPYESVAQECFPQARCVADRFHFVQHLNQELDEVRKAERKASPHCKALKHIKWPLLKRPHKRSEQQWARIKAAFEASPRLEKVEMLRNRFNELMDQCTDIASLSRQLDRWVERAEEETEGDFKQFIKTLHNWKSCIVAYAHSRLTNAATEGLNNIVRWIQRLSFGVPNFEHLRMRILLAFQNST